jgi:hypothetical protein
MSKNKKQLEQTQMEEPKVGYRITSSRVLEYTAEDYLPEETPPGTQTTVQFGFNVQSVFGITEDLANIVIVLSISGLLNNEPQRRICFLKTEHVFNAENLRTYLKDDRTIELPQPLMATLVGTALGMARGILFAKNFGMSYANIVMPMMDLGELLPKEPFNMGTPSVEMRVKLRQ